MKYKSSIVLLVFIGGLLLLAACQKLAPTMTSTPLPSSTPQATQVTYADPFAYCAAVGNTDTPDSRYTGVNVPDTVIQGYLKAAKLTNTTEPTDQLRAGTFWRCMNNKVYACNVGANLPCQSKANTSFSATAEMNSYCASNANSDSIPESVTGHDTIYSWKCQGTTAMVDKQIDKPDAQGFLSSIWYALN